MSTSDGPARSFAERHLRRLTYEVIHTESVPLQALFAVFAWPIVEDPNDDLAQESFFGERRAFTENRSGSLVGILLPSDFGQPSYGLRRGPAIDSVRKNGPDTAHAALTKGGIVGDSRRIAWLECAGARDDRPSPIIDKDFRAAARPEIRSRRLACLPLGCCRRAP